MKIFKLKEYRITPIFHIPITNYQDFVIYLSYLFSKVSLRNCITSSNTPHMHL